MQFPIEPTVWCLRFVNEYGLLLVSLVLVSPDVWFCCHTFRSIYGVLQRAHAHVSLWLSEQVFSGLIGPATHDASLDEKHLLLSCLGSYVQRLLWLQKWCGIFIQFWLDFLYQFIYSAFLMFPDIWVEFLLFCKIMRYMREMPEIVPQIIFKGGQLSALHAVPCWGANSYLWRGYFVLWFVRQISISVFVPWADNLICEQLDVAVSLLRWWLEFIDILHTFDDTTRYLAPEHLCRLMAADCPIANEMRGHQSLRIVNFSSQSQMKLLLITPRFFNNRIWLTSFHKWVSPSMIIK